MKNPLFLLDEIDKMSSDMRGDPASALLEVLDARANIAFSDHYLGSGLRIQRRDVCRDVELHEHSSTLLDGLEVIRLSGYTEDEEAEHRPNVTCCRSRLNVMH